MNKDMKFYYIFCFIALQILIISNINYSQINCITDSETHKHFVGFKVDVYPDLHTKIFINSLDTINKFLLLDTIFHEKQSIIFIVPGFFKNEIENHKNEMCIKLPYIKEGIYNLYILTRAELVFY